MCSREVVWQTRQAVRFVLRKSPRHGCQRWSSVGAPPSWRDFFLSEKDVSSVHQQNEDLTWALNLARPDSGGATRALLHAKKACHHRRRALHEGSATSQPTWPSKHTPLSARGVVRAWLSLRPTDARTWTTPRPTAADYAHEHNQSGPCATTHQLRVSAFFEAPGTDQRHSVTVSCARPRSAVSAEGKRCTCVLSTPQSFLFFSAAASASSRYSQRQTGQMLPNSSLTCLRWRPSTRCATNTASVFARRQHGQQLQCGPQSGTLQSPSAPEQKKRPLETLSQNGHGTTPKSILRRHRMVAITLALAFQNES